MTLFEWLTAQINGLAGVFKVGITLALTIFVAYKCIKSGLGLAAILIALTTGAIFYWAILGGGLEAIGGLMGQQAKPTP